MYIYIFTSHKIASYVYKNVFAVPYDSYEKFLLVKDSKNNYL